MDTRRYHAILFMAALAWPAAAMGQSFEGTMTQRTIELDENALFDLYFAEADEPDFESEADWIRHTAKQLFAIPMERLVGADGAQVEVITTWVKGSKVRSGAGAGGGMYVIADAATQTTWMVIPSQRAYVEFTAEDMEAAAADAARQAEEMMARMGIDPEDVEAYDEEDEYEDETGEGMFDGFAAAVRGLGLSQDVNGFSASAFEAVAGLEVVMGWCADDGMGLVATMETLAVMAGFDELEEEDEASGPSPIDMVCDRKLPVRTMLFSADAGLSYSVDEIRSVERISVSDERFEIPSGYTKRSLADLWRQDGP